MSTLTGHSQLTQQAVKELAGEYACNPLMQGLSAAGLPGAVVARDILDVLLLGHWLDYGQAHHFMRRFDGQSPYEAYEESVEWIRSNALSAARQLASRARTSFGEDQLAGLAAHAPRPCPATGVAAHASHASGCRNRASATGRYAGKRVFGGSYGHDPHASDTPNWQSLGNALHALQDSFSEGHVLRAEPGGETAPGPIKHIKVYGGEDKEGHSDFDELWRDEKSGKWSVDGRLAIEGSKALIAVVVNNAVVQKRQTLTSLDGWSSFKATWLAASDDLSTERVFEIDFIERFRTGPRFGAGSLTFSMDEEGMAAALLKECGTDMNKVYRVFKELDGHHNTDADDVAEIYLNSIRKQPGAIAAALKTNKPLIDLLIKVLDEGWTSSGEEACIKYLNELK
ncbi:MAG: hypothetical protein CMJ64_08985 [Planctomycetaceae bacterium]|nr:hypothetical protein [Planctomycetaceae bacterium]